MKSTFVAVVATCLVVLGACGGEPDADAPDSGATTKSQESPVETPSEVRWEVLPEPDYGVATRT